MNKKDYEVFKPKLERSADAVWLVAAWLSGQDHTVKIPPTRMTNKPGYTDDGDLFIIKEGGRTKRIEVKHIDTEFTSADDWPKHYRGFIVDAVHTYERKTPKPHTYVCVNLSKTHVAYLTCFDANGEQKKWKKEIRGDGKRGNKPTEWYIAPLIDITFAELYPDGKPAPRPPESVPLPATEGEGTVLAATGNPW